MTIQETTLSAEIKVFLEQRFFSTGQSPSVVEVQKHFSLTPQEVLPLVPLIRDYQEKNYLLNSSNEILDPLQFKVAQMLLNPSDRRSLRTKLKECGVTMKTYDAWRASPAFQKYFRDQIRKRFREADTTADLELMRLLEDGDLKAIQYYNEMTGRTQSNDQINLTRVLAMVMEILVQYVSSDNLRKIATELEQRVGDVLEVDSRDLSDPGPPVGRSSSMPRLSIRSGND